MNALLTLLSGWNESMNRFFTEELNQFFFRYAGRTKDLAGELFWGVVNFVVRVADLIRAL